ncbi:MAG: cell division protein FtsA [Acidobacteria bacterium]|nr:cell division protein FtsA [Acidobacteriota bacterium]
MASTRAELAAIDIGTTKVTVAVGSMGDNGKPRLIGIGTHPCKGMRKGVLVNLEAAQKSLKAAVLEAEAMSETEIDTAFVSVAGAHIRSFNSRGSIAVKGRDGEVSEEDMERVLEAARAVSLPQDREILHVLPQEYVVDGQPGIDQPLGMTARRIMASVHLVTGAATTVQNVITCINRTGIEVAEVVLGQLASAESVLTDDERQLGCLLIDIGGGTTDVAVFEKKAIWHTSVLPAGGDNFTNDIAVGLRTPIPDAERIKLRYGCATADLVDGEESLDVPSVGGRAGRVLSRRVLCEILEPRAEEIFTLVADDVKRSGFDQALRAGVILTGGGSLLDGLSSIAEKALDLPVRRGVPEQVEGLVHVSGNPASATVAGLLSYGARCGRGQRGPRMAVNVIHDVSRRVRDWLGVHF